MTKVYVIIGIIFLPIVIFELSTFILLVKTIYKVCRTQEKHEVESADLSAIAEVDWELFHDISERMGKKGFEVAGDYISSVDSGKMYIRLLKNYSEGIRLEAAQVMHGNYKGHLMMLETAFQEGDSVVSRTMIPPSGYKYVQEKVFNHLIMTPEELLERHFEDVKKYANGRKRSIDRLKADDKERILSDTLNLYKRQEKCGIMWFSKAEGGYRYTFYGAVRAAMQQMRYLWFQENAVQRSETKFKLMSKDGVKAKLGPIHYIIFVLNLLCFYGGIMVLFSKEELLSNIIIMLIGSTGIIAGKIFKDKSSAKNSLGK